jgi:DNA primase
MMDRSLLPPARTFYERELGELRRPSRGWTTPKAGCPFHESKSKTSFRVNLDSGGFCCFGCGSKGGDVVAFVMLRDRLDFKRAAQSLGAWRGQMSSRDKEECRLRREEAERKRILEEEKRETQRRERIQARVHLHAVGTLFREAIAEHDWLGMSELLPRVRDAETRYWRLAGLEESHEY